MAESQNDSRETRVNHVLAEYLAAKEQDASVHPGDWLARYPELADELRAFFAAESQLGKLAAEFPADPSRDLTIDSPEKPRAVDVGALKCLRYFGDYELLGEIARGGMGVVYRARQVSVNRLVAVKMILAGQLATPADVQRFKTEAETAANLDHPHIVPIYEVGEHEGQHYFSMKLIEGGGLNTCLERYQDNPRTAAELLLTIARAVHHAHQRGLLHRDLKPGNILIDKDGAPHVTDFGLAKRLASEGGVTHTGAIVGTPEYMAPEQAAGKKGLSTAADVYSLGAILYALLTGQPPFRGATVLETLRLVAEREPMLPQARNAKVDRDLATVCLKCLEKDPARRYTSAQELADELQRWLQGEAILARPAGRSERALKWARRNPLAATLTVAVAAAIACVAALGFALWQQAEHRNSTEIELNQQLVAKSLALDDRGKLLATQLHLESSLRDKLREESARVGLQKTELAKQLYLSRAALFDKHFLQAAALAQAEPRKALHLLENSNLFPLDLRDFSWGLYHQKCRARAVARLATGIHSWRFDSIAFSPDSRHLALGARETVRPDYGKALLAWDLATRAVTEVLPTRFSEIRHTIEKWFAGDSTARSADGRVKAVNDGGSITVHDDQGNKKAFQIKGTIDRARLSPSGTMLAVELTEEAGGSAVQVHDVRLHKVVGRLSRKQQLENDLPGGFLGVTDSGQIVLYLDGEEKLKVFTVDVADQANLRRGDTVTYPGKVKLVKGICPFGLRLFLDQGDLLVLWTWSTGERVEFDRPADGDPRDPVAFSPDGRLLAYRVLELATLSGRGSEVVVWDITVPPECVEFAAPKLEALAFSPDAGKVISWDGETLCERDTWTGQVVGRKHKLREHGLGKDAISPDGQTLLTNNPVTQEIALWDVPTLKRRCAIKTYSNLTVFSPDSRLLATEYRQQEKFQVALWDVATGALVQTMPVYCDNLWFSPDGNYLVSNRDRFFSFWHVKTGTKTGTAELDCRPEYLLAPVFVARQHLCVLGQRDGKEVQVHDLGSGQLLRKLPANKVQALAASPAGQLALAWGGKVVLWDTPSYTLQSVLIPQGLEVEEFGSLAFLDDGRSMLAWTTVPGQKGGHLNYALIVWNIATGQVRLAMKIPSDPAAGEPSRPGVVAPNGRAIALTLEPGPYAEVRVYRTEPGPQPTLSRAQRVFPPVFSPDGQTLASIQDNGQTTDVKLCQVATGEERVLASFASTHHDDVCCLAFSPNGQTLVLGGGEGEHHTGRTGVLRLWDVATRTERAVHAKLDFAVIRSLAFLPDGKTLAVGKGFGPQQHPDKPEVGFESMALFDLATGKLLTSRAERGESHLVAVAPDGKRRVILEFDDKKTIGKEIEIQFWDGVSNTLRHRSKVPYLLNAASTVVGAVFSPDGKTLAVSESRDGEHAIKLWDADTGTLRTTLQGFADRVRSLAFSPDNRRLVTAGFNTHNGCCDNSELLVWELATGNKKRLTLASDEPVHSVTWSPDGKHLAVTIGRTTSVQFGGGNTFNPIATGVYLQSTQSRAAGQ